MLKPGMSVYQLADLYRQVEVDLADSRNFPAVPCQLEIGKLSDIMSPTAFQTSATQSW